VVGADIPAASATACAIRWNGQIHHRAYDVAIGDSPGTNALISFWASHSW